MCGNIVMKRQQKIKKIKNKQQHSTTGLSNDFTPHSFNCTTLRKQITIISFSIIEKIIGKQC